MQLRAPERFVDVDVPEPGHRPLVEQRGLERSAPPLQSLGEALRREASAERLVAEPALQVGIRLFRLEQLPGAEPAPVAGGDIASLVPRYDGTPIRVRGQ